MIFRQFLHEEASCASYLVGCPAAGVTAIVDPQVDVGTYEAAAARHRLRITDVIDTHVALPDETEIYPGHFAGSTCGRGMDGKTVSTIGRERRTSPALKLDLDAFVAYQLSNAPPLPKDFDLIKRFNLAAEAAEEVMEGNRSRKDGEADEPIAGRANAR